ncbi:hypothetical protein MKX03_034082 [Papaver bracteatum]|nr:hypothetical protein MKX03_034082 [Papaver bracteatum]
MGIRFIILVNKQGQTRLAQYFEYLNLDQRRILEGEICSFVEHRNYKIVYKRYALLFFLIGVDDDENELAIFEFIHLLVKPWTCELDIMFHWEKVHFMLEEMVMNGFIVETSKSNVLAPIYGENCTIVLILNHPVTLLLLKLRVTTFWFVDI